MILLMGIGAGPATKPATTIYELRKQVEAMRAQIDELRAEVTLLRNELAQTKAAIPATTEKASDDSDPIATAIHDKKLAVGMTLEQAQQACGRGHKAYENVDGTLGYEWTKVSEGYPDANHRLHFMYGKQIAKFESGKITEIVDGGYWTD